MNLGTSLVESIFSSGATDIAADVSELALDAVLDEGILKDIPVFGWFVKGYGIVTTVKDRIFLKKIAMFLQGTGSTDNTSFLIKLSEISFCQKVGENLILLLERHDDIEKSYILGKVFAGYLCGKFDYDMFLKLATTVDRAFIGDLKNLRSLYDKMKSYDPQLGRPYHEFFDDEMGQSLCNSGLARSDGYTQEIYFPNKVGSLLLDLL